MITTSDVADSKSNTEGAEMGKVIIDAEIINNDDEGSVARGQLKPNEVRRTTVKNMLVDTGAMLVSIPEEDITKLGLRVVREAVSKFANGQRSVRKIYGPVRIKVMGREDHV